MCWRADEALSASEDAPVIRQDVRGLERAGYSGAFGAERIIPSFPQEEEQFLHSPGVFPFDLLVSSTDFIYLLQADAPALPSILNSNTPLQRLTNPGMKPRRRTLDESQLRLTRSRRVRFEGFPQKAASVQDFRTSFITGLPSNTFCTSSTPNTPIPRDDPQPVSSTPPKDVVKASSERDTKQHICGASHESSISSSSFLATPKPSESKHYKNYGSIPPTFSNWDKRDTNPIVRTQPADSSLPSSPPSESPGPVTLQHLCLQSNIDRERYTDGWIAYLLIISCLLIFYLTCAGIVFVPSYLLLIFLRWMSPESFV